MQTDKGSLASEEIQNLFSTNIMKQHYLNGFTRRQQLCTQPSTPVVVPENVDANGNVRVTIDPNQRLKTSIDACSSCENMGGFMSKIVHGGCVELFRIKFDEPENPDNPIRSLELDLRSTKNAKVENPPKESLSDRMRLLEARMRGSDIHEPSEKEDTTKSIAIPEELPSEKLIQGIKAIADRCQKTTEKKQSVILDDEKSVATQLVVKSNPSEKHKKKEEKNIQNPPGQKTVSLIQPRARNAKSNLPFQLGPQPKKPKKSKKSKDALSATKVIGSPVQAITVYDRPTDDDPTLRNPQPAWAKKTGNELIITEEVNHEISKSASSQYRFSGGSEIPSAPEMPWYRPFEIEESRKKIERPPPVKANEPSFFVLLSHEDEKPSPLHRTDILRSQQSFSVNTNTLNLDSKPLLDSEDEWETSGASSTSGPHARKTKVQQGREETAILLNRESLNMSYQNTEESLSAAMGALKMEDGFQAAVNDLQYRGEKVAAEIEMLKDLQEKHQQQDYEIDQLLDAPLPTVKYRILKQGEPLPLAQTLDELIDTGARNAPSFEPSSLREGTGESISNAIQIHQNLCRQPSDQEKLDWLASLESSSPSTISRPVSASDADETMNQESEHEQNNICNPANEQEPTETIPFQIDMSINNAKILSRPLPIPRDVYDGPIKAPPGFEGHFPNMNSSQNCSHKPIPMEANHPIGLLRFPTIPITLRHPGPDLGHQYLQKSLIERLGDEFEKFIDMSESD
ncbi:hypothetical protein TWF694_005442 [Orbilia ellipsospora]|uniref:Uncharacterized protein n=1 Tax=Orbilia ellipsospora TaxID=2528407 RepID=A0AAV9WVJ8_9PEZI